MGATGNLCGSCEPAYYNLGPLCAKCNESTTSSAMVALSAVSMMLALLWRLTKVKSASSLDMNCVVRFCSKKGGFEVRADFAVYKYLVPFVMHHKPT